MITVKIVDLSQTEAEIVVHKHGTLRFISNGVLYRQHNCKLWHGPISWDQLPKIIAAFSGPVNGDGTPLKKRAAKKMTRKTKRTRTTKKKS